MSWRTYPLLRVERAVWMIRQRLAGRSVIPERDIQAPPDASEQTVVITGASAGIGLETALWMSQLGYRVVITGRTPKKLHAAKAAVQANSQHEVRALLADFAEMSQVHQLADQILAQCPKIDVLIHNAGGSALTRRETADGFEQTLAVNHLAPFLLTHRLQQRLEDSRSRVIVVASRMHHECDGFDYDDPHFLQRPYGALVAYNQSKLANVMFALELAERMAPHGVVVHALHPGDVSTDIVRIAGMELLRPLMNLVLMVPREGAATSVWLASTQDDLGTGRYFHVLEQQEPHAHALNAVQRQRLWAWTQQQLGLL
jgi:retinol dehydrogenase 14